MNFYLAMAICVVLAATIAFFALRKDARKSKTSTDPGKVSKPVPEISALDLRDMVTKSSAPVAVLFWREGCPACDTMKPYFQEASDNHKGNVRFVRINVLQNRSTSRALGIKRIPTLMVFQGNDTTPLNSRIGALEPEGIEQFIVSAVQSQKG